MKVNLLYQDYEFDYHKKLLPYELEVIQDLELDILFNAMANGDKFIFEVVKAAVFTSLQKEEEINYRQHILKDCIKNSQAVRKLYNIATEAIDEKRKHWWGVTSDFTSSVVHSSISFLEKLLEMLKKLRKVAIDYGSGFESKGFTSLIDLLTEELDNDYLSVIEIYLQELRFNNGILISSELGNKNEGINYVLRRQSDKKSSWLKWRFAPGFYVHERDDNGQRDLSRRAERAMNITANALAQSAEQVLNFFITLQTELAFYVGCINLYESLLKRGEPVCFPMSVGLGEYKHNFKGLYDICLSITVHGKVVGNDLNADNKCLAVITGANQGGKSTFLRSIGQAQLMMQCGMFVAAESFCANISSGVFTHYKREEDINLKSGKLDEELGRMSSIADYITSNSLVLFNESFASTNEREGSEIGRQVVYALLEKHIKVFFVTHMYEFSKNFYKQHKKNNIFLRAERKEKGERTYRIIEGEPLATSFGEDLYNKIFLQGQGLS